MSEPWTMSHWKMLTPAQKRVLRSMPKTGGKTFGGREQVSAFALSRAGYLSCMGTSDGGLTHKFVFTQTGREIADDTLPAKEP